MKVWILLGQRGDRDEDGSEVVAVFRHEPSKEEQQRVLEEHVQATCGIIDPSPEDIREQMDWYTAAEGGSLVVTFTEAQP